jgi:Tfp pilus assembly protein PilF
MRSLKLFFWLILVSLPLAAQPPEEPGFAERIMELLNQGNYALALTTIFDALAANPEDKRAHDALATVYDFCVMQGQTEVLEESFRDWSEQDPPNPLAHCWLGAALAAQPDREDEAEEAYQQALELDPNCADAHFRLAALWQWQGKEAEAQAEWRKFLELEPDSDRAWLVRHRLVVLEARLLTQEEGNPMEQYPSWSPDGKWIAYRKGWEGTLAVCRVESGETRELATVPPKQGLCILFGK